MSSIDDSAASCFPHASRVIPCRIYALGCHLPKGVRFWVISLELFTALARPKQQQRSPGLTLERSTSLPAILRKSERLLMSVQEHVLDPPAGHAGVAIHEKSCTRPRVRAV